jgi:MFS superfamily sulfate permease-like transporter
MDFISFPVMKAFTSAAAITIAASQMKVSLLQIDLISHDFITVGFLLHTQNNTVQ